MLHNLIYTILRKWQDYRDGEKPVVSREQGWGREVTLKRWDEQVTLWGQDSSEFACAGYT